MKSVHTSLREHILDILLNQLREVHPWLIAEALRETLSDSGQPVSREAVTKELLRLEREGYVEIDRVDPEAIERGYVARLSLRGRNKIVHGKWSLTGS